MSYWTSEVLGAVGNKAVQVGQQLNIQLTATDPDVGQTLVFSSSAPNQALTVTYTAAATNGNNGYVLLQAATLQ